MSLFCLPARLNARSPAASAALYLAHLEALGVRLETRAGALAALPGAEALPGAPRAVLLVEREGQLLQQVGGCAPGLAGVQGQEPRAARLWLPCP